MQLRREDHPCASSCSQQQCNWKTDILFSMGGQGETNWVPNHVIVKLCFSAVFSSCYPFQLNHLRCPCWLINAGNCATRLNGEFCKGIPRENLVETCHDPRTNQRSWWSDLLCSHQRFWRRDLDGWAATEVQSWMNKTLGGLIWGFKKNRQNSDKTLINFDSHC